jgi:hypothetical protein
MTKKRQLFRLLALAILMGGGAFLGHLLSGGFMVINSVPVPTTPGQVTGAIAGAVIGELLFSRMFRLTPRS